MEPTEWHVKKAREVERERCARIAETRHLSSTKYAENPYDDIAAAIRDPSN